MLEEVLRYINNRFECATVVASFAVRDGALELPGAQEGQYYWVEGSVFNDGLHRYGDADLVDEEPFDGRAVLLAVPRAVADLAAEIGDWCEANAEAIGGPYQSESFGGYSYSKASVGAQGNEMPAAAWQAQFGSRLRQWRKLSRDWM